MDNERKQYPRSKLQVTETAGEPKSFGDHGGQVLNFRAKFTGPENSSWLGQVMGFGCFKKDLFATIQATAIGSTLECDVETKPYQAQDGERLNFNITQIYVDGQPVVVKAQGRGGYGNVDSPEKLKSIEDQNRSARITDLWIAGKVNDEDPLVKKLRTWLGKLGSPESSLKAEPALKSEEKTAAPPGEKGDPKQFKNVGEFLTAMNKKGLSRQQVIDELIRLKMINTEADLPELDLVIAWEALGDAIISEETNGK